MTTAVGISCSSLQGTRTVLRLPLPLGFFVIAFRDLPRSSLPSYNPESWSNLTSSHGVTRDGGEQKKSQIRVPSTVC